MKVIAFNRHPGFPVRIPPEVEIIVDSATVSAGRPVFLPDFSDGWVARLYPAFRISRLGKDIGEKFAARYFDSFTIVLRLVPVALERSLAAAGAPSGVLGLYDYCLALGEWMPLPDSGEALRVECGGLSVDIAPAEMRVEEAVSAVSRYATLKIGDVVLPCALPDMVSVKAGDDISVKVADASLPPFSIR